MNANVAKVVLESKLGTPVTLVDIDENATWPGLDSGSIDAVLEVWPSGHAADCETYIDRARSRSSTSACSARRPRSAGTSRRSCWRSTPSWRRGRASRTPTIAKLFATAESGDLGQFLMGDPSYVTYDEQIITNLNLPLKFVVAGSEAALITAIQQADRRPEAAAAAVLAAALAAVEGGAHRGQAARRHRRVHRVGAAPSDGKYACDYPIDKLYKAASVKLQTKNAKAFAFLSKMQLTTDQQNEIAAYVDGDGMTPAAAAQKWVDANADVVAGSG